MSIDKVVFLELEWAIIFKAFAIIFFSFSQFLRQPFTQSILQYPGQTQAGLDYLIVHPFWNTNRPLFYIRNSIFDPFLKKSKIGVGELQRLS